MNEYEITGRLGQDAEHKTLDSGREVINFSMAVSRKKKEGDEWKEVPQWHRVAYWGKNLSKLSGALLKGSLVQVNGIPWASAYTDKEGKAVGSLEVRANRLELHHSTKEKTAMDSSAPQPGADDDDLPW